MKIRIVLAAAALLAAPSVASAAEWQPLPPAEYAFQANNLVDMAQTLDIKNHPDLQEANPLFGNHPGDGEVIAVKLAGGAAHAAITEYLLQRGASPRVILLWEAVTIGLGVGVVGHNANLGLHLSF